MENSLNASQESDKALDRLIPEASNDSKLIIETKEVRSLDDSINLETNSPTISPTVQKDESSTNAETEEIFQLRGEDVKNTLSGVYFQGVQYFDLKNVNFINNTGIANLIDLLKSLLEQGVVIKFVNVKDKIKTKFKSLGLDSIFHFS
ncbi:MAG: STAS domain-containing protein [Bacteroidota bacterium]